ncbi:hypothetical protein HD806DRAFT_543950 [Xylariaceae sp. AK1471]|nr:hypothetical protein HD806DRAFT_543950 [Xylariaceae sp. AK1471]
MDTLGSSDNDPSGYDDETTSNLQIDSGGGVEGSDELKNNDNSTDDGGLKEFTLFPRLPYKLRKKIWGFSMNEQPRLVHLKARGIGINWHMRYGCPRGFQPGRRIKINNVEFEQVPRYLFVNRECRQLALEHYTILFRVCQTYRESLESPPQVRTCHLIMSPNDILASWYQENWYHWPPRYKGYPDYEEGRFNIEFGPQARLIRNILVRPFDFFNRYYGQDDHDEYLVPVILACNLIEKLQNEAALEKIFVLDRYDRSSPLRYKSCSSQSIDDNIFGQEFRIMYQCGLDFLQNRIRDNRLPKFYLMEPEKEPDRGEYL